MKFFKNSIYVVLLLLIATSNTTLNAQQNFFKSLESKDARTELKLPKYLKEAKILTLDEQSAKRYLQTAPMEFKNEGKTLPFDVVLPDGRIETFGLVESPILDSKVAVLRPDIKTYSGNGLNNKALIIRVCLSDLGFNAIILNVETSKSVYIEQSNQDKSLYFSYFAKLTLSEKEKNSFCKVKNEKEHSIENKIIQERGVTNNTGANLRTYRLAVCCTGEFTLRHGATPANAYTVLVNYVNRMNAVFERDLSVRFTLVTSSAYCFPDSLTDGYTNGDTGLMADQNAPKLNTLLGVTNFDIGHVLGVGVGTGSGIAVQPGVCDDSHKAKGATLEGNPNSYDQPFFDHALFHEVGHQFNMEHSYNSKQGICDTRNLDTSVEPGAGASLMSYGFTCGSDDYIQNNTTGAEIVKFFHSTNYSQAILCMTSSNASTCGTSVATGNTPPTVTMPTNYTIPKSTPFELVGTATDPNGDALTYSWEGMNIGGVADPIASDLDNTTKSPFSRTYNPVTTGKRTFPLLSAILNGTNQAKGDKLPSIATTLNYRMTVRDNRAGGGGSSFGTVAITVDGTKGPFLETTNFSGVYMPNTLQNLTWSVNGTNTMSPNIKISASGDGGLTFPYVLAASTPNDGTEIVAMPNINTSTARIKIEAIGNVFFDISNIDFILAGPLAVTLTSFAGKKDRNTNLLIWETASESNNEGFEVERSHDGNRFEKIAFTKGHGTTNQTQNYSCADLKPINGINYYRLKQVDFDGRYKYSNVLTLINDDNMTIAVYPNPSTGIFSIVLANEANETDEAILIYNAFGQKINVQVNQNQLDLSGQPSGLYYLQTQNQVLKLIKK